MRAVKGCMERRFSEIWPKRVPPRPKDVPEPIYVATYTAVVDVYIVRAELRFDEALHPDEIPRVLETHEWGSDLPPKPTYSINPLPPEGCTERTRFRLMALQKMSIFLFMAERVHGYGTMEDLQAEMDVFLPDWPRVCAYTRFPTVLAAREAGGGPYRSCTLESHVRDDGFVFHDYHFNTDPEGPPPPGLVDDNATMIFARSLAQGDLRRRTVALSADG